MKLNMARPLAGGLAFGLPDSPAYRGGGTAAQASPPVFQAAAVDGDLSMALLQNTGEGTPSCSRTTYYTYTPEFEGIFRYTKPGFPMWWRGRTSANELEQSTDLDGAGWAALSSGATGSLTTDYAADPDGGTGAARLQVDRSTTSQYYLWRKGLGVTTTGPITSIWLKSNTESTQNVALGPATGELVAVDVTTSWQLFSVTVEGSVSSIAFLVGAYLTVNSDLDLDILIYAPQIELQRWNATVPSPRIPTTTTEEHACYVAYSGYSATGNVISGSDFGELYGYNPWLWCYRDDSNELTQSNSLDTSPWAATEATVESEDYEFNSENWIIRESSNAGEHYVEHSATLSGTASFSIFAKQLTSGRNLRVTVSNSDVDSTIDVDLSDGSVIGTPGSTYAIREITTGIYCISVKATSSPSDTVGFRLQILSGSTASYTGDGTSGVRVFCGARYTNLHPSQLTGRPPIVTATSAVASTSCQYSFDIDNHDNTQGLYTLTFSPFVNSGDSTADIRILSLDNDSGLLFYDQSEGKFTCTDGTNTATFTHALTAGETIKLAVAYGDSKMAIGVNDEWGSEASYDGAFTIGSSLVVGYLADCPFLIRDIRRYDMSYSDGKLLAWNIYV